jgi:hypothetical protein
MSILTGFSWDIAYLLGYVNYINEEKQKALWAALNGWQHYWYISAFVTNVFLGVGAVVSGIGLCALTIQKIQNRKGVSKTQKRPGFLKASYLTFKDKVCFKVNFK